MQPALVWYTEVVRDATIAGERLEVEFIVLDTQSPVAR